MAPPAVTSTDWWAVPTPVLASIFRRVLENYGTVGTIARHWTYLATVCRAWLHAARLTPLCLNLAESTHLSDPQVREWMSKCALEVVIVNRNAAVEHQMAAGAGVPLFDCDLLSRPETASNSGIPFLALINASLNAAPLLRPFTNLRQLSLFSPVLPASAAPEIVDVAALAPLTQLTCLTLAGHMAVPDFTALPASLKHLSVSLHHRNDLNMGLFFSGEAQTVYLPPHLTQLEFLCLKANYLIVSWEDVLTRCREIHLSANYLGLTTAGGSLHDPRRFAEALAAATTVECAMLAFQRLGLFPPTAAPPVDLRPAHGDVDLDNLLTAVRERVLVTWDMDPVMDAPPLFVNDTAPLDECLCLTLERQEPGYPRSYHFTTAMTDSEIAVLRNQPAWRLVMCRDPRTAEVLADPGFIAANAPHLTHLSRCMLPEGVDLRPFAALRSLHCELEAMVSSIRFPPGLTSLELEVPQPTIEVLNDLIEDDLPSIERRKFSTSALGALHALRVLTLTGWHRHDLVDLASSVTSLKLINPLMESPEGFVETLGEEALRLPRVLMLPTSAAEATLAGAEADLAAVGPLNVRTGELQAEEDQLQEQQQQCCRPRRRRMLHHDNDLDELAHLSFPVTELVNGTYEYSPGDEDAQRTCTDPTCPVHSGKHHLHLIFSDTRTEIPIDLFYFITSGFPMLYITVDPDQEAAHAGVNLHLRVGPSWPAFVQALKTSKIEVLNVNHQRNEGSWVTSDGTHHRSSLWEGLHALQAELSDVFHFRTWDGEAMRPGLIPQGAGYSLVRTQRGDAPS